MQVARDASALLELDLAASRVPADAPRFSISVVKLACAFGALVLASLPILITRPTWL